MGEPRLGILAGPGVVAAGAVDGLRRFAAAVGCGVVNTWGAKGVFRWDDPHHFGTAGLQARDFELAGLATVEVLVTTGLDPAEVTAAPWEGRAEVVDIPPPDLATAAGSVPLPPGSLERPALYTELSRVVAPLYESTAVPVAAARAARALAGAVADDGLVVAEPGIVGFWVARTFPTTRPGSVVVPAAPDRAVARRVAVDAAAAGHRVSLVAHEPCDLPGVRVEVWTPDAVDLDPAPLTAVAGPIVAWGGVG